MGPAEKRTDPRRLWARSTQPHLPFAGCVLGLTCATWLYLGYLYGEWPQSGFLDWVLRYEGEFTNDFQTSQPAGHWFFANSLGLLPTAALEPTLVAIWVGGLLVLWTGFLSICRALATPLAVAFAAGLVTIPTGLSGFGATSFLLPFVYPRCLAFALAIAAVAALLYGRWALGGSALGLSVLVHPSVGVLTALAIAGGAAATQHMDRAAVLRVALPAVLFSAPAVAQAALDQASGPGLSAQEQYELAAIVTTPQHYLYSEFTPLEYVFTGLWSMVLVVGFAALRRSPAARLLGAIALVAVLVCLAGAVAGEVGRPVLLVIVQTSSLSPLFVVFGVILGAALLARRAGAWAAPALLALLLLAPAVKDLVPLAPGGRTSAVEAGLLLAALALVSIAQGPLSRRRAVAAFPRLPLAIAPVALAALLAGSAFSFASHEPGLPPNPPEPFRDAAEVAHRISRPSDVFLTPPELGGFRAWARRATVVEFGTVQYGDGLDEWRRRMIATTRNPEVVDPDFGTDPAGRDKLIGDSYDQAVATSREPICRYGVRFVLARGKVPAPPWLTQVYTNGDFQILEVRPGACDP